ncbi:hypothetical protein BKA69DRAFT_1027879 [Paraphysoderma sedebokerense]|nr:hypothetical protein BKA69DRAFT_1027879 [Paraphysoderma sedebokerense]
MQAQIQKVAARIYINDGSAFKTLNLNSLMTAEMVVHEIVDKAMLEQSDEWTLFEIFNDLFVERPLKDWEIVTSVLRSWERETQNAIMILNYPKMCGWLLYEVKKGKYQRKYFELQDDGLYEARDNKKAPTKFCFALKSIERMGLFEDIERDYIHFFCTEHLDKMKDWVLSIRNAKVSSSSIFCVSFGDKIKSVHFP